MQYTQHVFDRRTGEVVEVSAGDWITITELGELMGVSSRRIRTILREMGFLYVEGGRAHNRHRLVPWVIQSGFGRHIPAKPPKVRYPFDVIGPEGRQWIEARWADSLTAMEAKPARSAVIEAKERLDCFRAQRLNDLNVQGCVHWLCDSFPDLTHTEMATILDVTQQLVSRYVSLRMKQKAAKMQRVSHPLPDLGRVRLTMGRDDDAVTFGWHADDVLASGGARFITQAHNTLQNDPHPSGQMQLAA